MAELRIASDCLQAIARAAAASYPQECCGLLVGQRFFAATMGSAPAIETHRVVTAVVATDNAWEPSLLSYTDAQGQDSQAPGEAHSVGDRYWIDPAVMLQVQRSTREQGLEIVGIYHSHPDHPAIPSECDRTLAWPVYSYIIASVRQGQVVDLKSWRLDGQHQFQPEPVKMIGSSANKAPFLS
ncbi:M67 family metallopeptidase [Nodosilinea sp. E11]|uniref:M67 family metallopeptidase n=1 Tax=Nodosilinea sp. E11 TaxID=3037479 RepID=UPI002934EDEA|nr:M67 family metallopeptidase [Nodosilinea sp. E11]WOD38247.1 M67 family metallopeptidase [Nodosilinea sp. E11]